MNKGLQAFTWGNAKISDPNLRAANPHSNQAQAGLPSLQSNFQIGTSHLIKLLTKNNTFPSPNKFMLNTCVLLVLKRVQMLL